MSGNTPNISQDTFNVSAFNRILVKLQQGVPVTDSDWNEQAQLLLRESYKFSGISHGVYSLPPIPTLSGGPVGFRVLGESADNDFTVTPGHMVVYGAVVSALPVDPTNSGFLYSNHAINYLLQGRVSAVGPTSVEDTDKNFQVFMGLPGCRLIITSGVAIGNEVVITARNSQTEVEVTGSLAGVVPGDTFTIAPPAIPTPINTDPIEVVLMVWWDDLNENEEPQCVHPGLLIETSHRTQLRWCVRAGYGAYTDYPEIATGYMDFEPRFVKAASIARAIGVAAIAAGDVTKATMYQGDTLTVTGITRALDKPYYSDDQISDVEAGRLYTVLINMLSALQKKRPLDQVGSLTTAPKILGTTEFTDAPPDSMRTEFSCTGNLWSVIGGYPDPSSTAAEILPLYDGGMVYLEGYTTGIHIRAFKNNAVLGVPLNPQNAAHWTQYEYITVGGMILKLGAGHLNLDTRVEIGNNKNIFRTVSTKGVLPVPLIKDVAPGGTDLPVYPCIYESGIVGVNKIRMFASVSHGIVVTFNAYYDEIDSVWKPDFVGGPAWRTRTLGMASSGGTEVIFVAPSSWIESAWDNIASLNYLPDSSTSGYKKAAPLIKGGSIEDIVRYALLIKNPEGADTQQISGMAAVTWHGEIDLMDAAAIVSITETTTANVLSVALIDIDKYGGTVYLQSNSVVATTYIASRGRVTVRTNVP